MRAAVAYLSLLFVGLWMGGLVALILFVASMFQLHRSVAVDAAPILFRVFERYQLFLAALAILTVMIWQFIARSKLKIASLVALLLATILAVVQISWITPTINAARGVDQAKFDQFHHLASKNYSTLAVLVLIAGWLILRVARREASYRAPDTMVSNTNLV